MILYVLAVLSISGILQGGNIFAALSQGQSDEDEETDLDEEDKPAIKVQCCISHGVKLPQNKCSISVWCSLISSLDVEL